MFTIKIWYFPIKKNHNSVIHGLYNLLPSHGTLKLLTASDRFDLRVIIWYKNIAAKFMGLCSNYTIYNLLGEN